jgi:hypothetical protein
MVVARVPSSQIPLSERIFSYVGWHVAHQKFLPNIYALSKAKFGKLYKVAIDVAMSFWTKARNAGVRVQGLAAGDKLTAARIPKRTPGAQMARITVDILLNIQGPGIKKNRTYTFDVDINSTKRDMQTQMKQKISNFIMANSPQLRKDIDPSKVTRLKVKDIMGV